MYVMQSLYIIFVIYVNIVCIDIIRTLHSRNEAKSTPGIVIYKQKYYFQLHTFTEMVATYMEACSHEHIYFSVY
jgi:hypothetical protein